MFDRLLADGIRRGRVMLIDHHGRAQTFGAGEPHVTLRVADAATDRALGFMPWLKVGEAYMDGTFEIVEGSLRDFLDLFHRNSRNLRSLPVRRALGVIDPP